METKQIAALVVAPIMIAPVGGAINIVARLIMGIALPTFTAAAVLCAIGTVGFGLGYCCFEEELNMGLVCGGLTGLAMAFFAGYTLKLALYTGALIIFTIALLDYKFGESKP